MKNTNVQTKWLVPGLLVALVSLLVNGCDTTRSHSIKTHGIYTTLATPELAPLASFDFPGSATIQQDKFEPGQTPVAVITGYGGCQVALEVVELTTGKSQENKEIYIGPNMVSCQPLNINKSGDYQLRLLYHGVEQDTFKFSVTRGMPKSDEYDAIISRMDAVLQRDPQDAYAYSSRGHAYEGKRDFDRAISDYTQALWLLPNDAALHTSRGKAYFAKGDMDAAIKDFTEVIRLNPDDARAFNFRGFAYGRKGEWDELISDYSEIIRRNPDAAGAYVFRGNGYAKKGEFDSAISDYTEAIKRNSGNALAYYYRGFYCCKKGDYKKGVSDYREAIRRNPTLGVVYNEMAWVLASCPADNARDGKAAVAAARNACEMAEWKNGRWVDTLAAAYAEAGDFENAVKYEHQALATQGVTETERAKMQHRLSLYEQNQPYREPLK